MSHALIRYNYLPREAISLSLANKNHFRVRPYIFPVKVNFPLSLRCGCSVSGEAGNCSVRTDARISVTKACTAFVK